MKQIRVFSSEEIRDAVLDAADYSILYVTEGMGVGLKAVRPDYSEPFYVENITNETETLTIISHDDFYAGNVINIQVEYSTDRINWNSLGTTGEIPLTKTLEPGDKIYLRAMTDTWYYSEKYGGRIKGVSKVGGNIMSLLYGSDFTGDERSFPNETSYNFYGLFQRVDESKLIDASKLILPATTLTDYCYEQMFQSCTSLTTAPELPAITLAQRCYGYMFQGCTSLTTAPKLPATTLVKDCYRVMFQGCTSLTTAPELPATELTSFCYWSMFQGCTNLNYIKCYATDISASNCLLTWTKGVSSTGTFVKTPGVSYPTGDNGIPSGWTVEEI